MIIAVTGTTLKRMKIQPFSMSAPHSHGTPSLVMSVGESIAATLEARDASPVATILLLMERYDPQSIERKWQESWERELAFVFRTPSDPEAVDEPPHTYVLEMLPYPSGELHMGHVFNYTLGDVVSHVKRRRGVTVLRPMGYDAFGLPAENAAIREGVIRGRSRSGTSLRSGDR